MVVDVSNSPSFEGAAVLEFFATSTRNLLAAEAGRGRGPSRRAVGGGHRSPRGQRLLPRQARSGEADHGARRSRTRSSTRHSSSSSSRASPRRPPRVTRSASRRCSSSRWPPTTSPAAVGKVSRGPAGQRHPRDRRARAVPPRRARPPGPAASATTHVTWSPTRTRRTSAPSWTSARWSPATALSSGRPASRIGSSNRTSPPSPSISAVPARGQHVDVRTQPIRRAARVSAGRVPRHSSHDRVDRHRATRLDPSHLGVPACRDDHRAASSVMLGPKSGEGTTKARSTSPLSASHSQ